MTKDEQILKIASSTWFRLLPVGVQQVVLDYPPGFYTVRSTGQLAVIQLYEGFQNEDEPLYQGYIWIIDDLTDEIYTDQVDFRDLDWYGVEHPEYVIADNIDWSSCESCRN